MGGGILYAVGQANFLFDKSQTPYMKASELAERIGVGNSTLSAKAKELQKMLKINFYSAEWALPSLMEHNPLLVTSMPFLTAHMSKGLQFDVVFIIGLSEGTFPDYRAIQSGGEQLEQEKNNMYVAVTRAKRLCYMSYPIRKRMPWGVQKIQRPSRYDQVEFLG